MSFSVIGYRCNSAVNVVDKDLNQEFEVTGVLRDGSSVIDPVILIEANSPGFHANDVNYLYIQEFRRYYYITNIVSSNYTLWEIHGHVDVLMSYKEQIRAQTAIVARQEAQYNLYLDDGVFMAYQNPIVQTKLFSVEDPFETQSFVLMVAGSSST